VEREVLAAGGSRAEGSAAGADLAADAVPSDADAARGTDAGAEAETEAEALLRADGLERVRAAAAVAAAAVVGVSGAPGGRGASGVSGASGASGESGPAVRVELASATSEAELRAERREINALCFVGGTQRFLLLTPSEERVDTKWLALALHLPRRQVCLIPHTSPPAHLSSSHLPPSFTGAARGRGGVRGGLRRERRPRAARTSP
jgi:hypothetical protein